MSIKLQYLTSCTGRIGDITRKLKLKQILPVEIPGVTGELNRLKEAEKDLLSNLTEDETILWKAASDKTISPEERDKIAAATLKRMNENRDKPSI